MEKIVYSERIRELADILARKLVVRKAKNLWATAMQHTKNALVVDYSAAMDVSRDCMLIHERFLQIACRFRYSVRIIFGLLCLL